MTTNLLVPTHILAQSATNAPSFPLPTTVENGTTVRIDGSSGLSAINQNLKQSFEKQFAGTKVEIAANGTDAALKALLDGKIDIAALGRGLTPQEQAQGLEQVRLHREKIAIIVGADNPFKGSLTARQFARIFRGQITDWSQLGRSPGKIQVLDRPTTSDTRNTFRSYPAFKSANFATGSTATQIADDNTAEIVKQLGKDGISYALANQISQLPGVRVLQIHQTSPTDAKYPFSQPLVYAYKKNPNTGIAGFLGFAIAPPGQQAIEAARTAEAAAIAQGGLQAFATTTTTSPAPEATTAVTASPSAEAINTTADTSVTTAPNESLANPAANDNARMQREAPFWLLLPLLAIAVLGGLSYWWFLKRRPRAVEEADKDSASQEPTISPTPAIASGTGAAIPSGFSDTGLTDETRNNGDTAWDTEAPAAVVNTPYPHIAEVPTAATSELPKAELPATTSDNSEVPIVASDAQNRYEEQSQAESNIAEDSTSTDSAVVAAGAGIAAGAATWSAVTGTESNSEDGRNPVGNTNYSIWDSPESELSVNDTAATLPDLPEVPEQTGDVELPIIETAATLPDLPDVPEQTGDVELPIIETAATLPDLPDVPEQTGDVELPIIETAATLPDLPDVPEQTGDVELPIIETAATLPDLPEIPEQAGDAELPIIETAATLPDLPDVPDVALDAVADEAESSTDATEEEIIEIVSNLPEPTSVDASPNLEILAGGAVAAGAGIGAWANLYSDREDNDASLVEASTNGNDADSVNLRSHTPKWAYVSWQISNTQKQTLENSGSKLTLRLYDVTDIDLSYQNPHLVQQYECDELARDRFVAIPTSDRNYIAEIGYITDGDRWVRIARSAIVRVFSNPYIPSEDTDDLAATNVKDSISFIPQTSELATASWRISDANKQALQDTGCQLALRLYDVSGIDLSYQTPQFIQQHEFDPATESSSIAIPASDRDYIAEIGYATDSEHWVSIARSEIVRVFSRLHTENQDHADLINANTAPIESSITLTPRTSKWAYVNWYISETDKQVLQNSGISQLAIRIYDVTDLDLSYQTPQFVQQYECEELSQDRFVAIPTSDRDYIVEIGYVAESDRWVSIARSTTVRIFSRLYPNFWFVADTELIIHGATEPDAIVNIAGHTIKLKPDGTFHVRIPFSDSLIDYLMTATSADGQHTTIVHKKFSQDTPEA
ncbi:DUF4912 domain-containing protein [Calothrix sp. NIES-2098]|uniref:DUF4912 domain-containing protein n=1 Tax=Calothrix sp. NIES-2098 TaxID=1954171 RepID=UPI0030D97B69